MKKREKTEYGKTVLCLLLVAIMLLGLCPQVAFAATDVTLTFTDGKLSMMEYSASFVQNSIKFTATSCITCTEYGEIGTN